MTRSRKDIEKSLKKKGFKLRSKTKTKSRNNSAHRYYDLWINGQNTGISTHVSRGSKYKELHPSLLSQMAKQVKLKSGQFQQLIDCPMDIDEYQEILKGGGFLPH